MRILKKYLAFHDKFKFPKPKKYELPSDEVIATRLNFLLEELKETGWACGFSLSTTNNKGVDSVKFTRNNLILKDKEGIVDGLVDLLYVVLGTAVFFGLHNVVKKSYSLCKRSIFEEAFNRVHAANMAKERVKNASESKRGTKYDMKKPEDWKAPQFKDLY